MLTLGGREGEKGMKFHFLCGSSTFELFSFLFSLYRLSWIFHVLLRIDQVSDVILLSLLFFLPNTAVVQCEFSRSTRDSCTSKQANATTKQCD